MTVSYQDCLVRNNVLDTSNIYTRQRKHVCKVCLHIFYLFRGCKRVNLSMIFALDSVAKDIHCQSTFADVKVENCTRNSSIMVIISQVIYLRFYFCLQASNWHENLLLKGQKRNSSKREFCCFPSQKRFY